MKVAIIGYGKMGRMIEEVLKQKGHRVSVIIDQQNIHELQHLSHEKTDVAIEFTEPASAESNMRICLEKGICVVSGTTGWNVPDEEFGLLCATHQCAYIQSSNYNPGTHLFFHVNRVMAERAAALGFRIRLSETHHIHKKDKPSGTAITLADHIIHAGKSYTGWQLAEPGSDVSENVIPIESYREGEVTGIHTAEWISGADTIQITHTAHNRTGFALGAVMAAEAMQGRVGRFTMNDLLTEIFKL